jgi:hypothetical protein
MIRRHVVSVTSDGSGDATAYTPYISGYLESIEYVKTDFTDGVDFTITDEATGKTLWTESNVNAAKVCLPRGATHSNAGVAALYAAGGTAVNDKFALGRTRVKIVVASAGAAKVGAFHVTMNDGK